MSKGRIVLVEDEKNTRECLEIELEREGFVVFSYDRWYALAEDLEKRGFKYDLAVIDFSLPQVDGLQIIKRLRKRDRNAVILGYSGYDDLEIKDADEIVTKDDTNNDLVDVVNSYFD